MTTRDGSPPLGPDPPAQGDTRRAFLIRLAKTTAFLPPMFVTHDIAWAQGGGGGGNPPGLSRRPPKNKSVATPELEPWAIDATAAPQEGQTGAYGGAPPWAREPPGPAHDP